MAEALGAVRFTGSPFYAKALSVSKYNFGRQDFTLDVSFSCGHSQGGPLLTKFDGANGWEILVRVDGRLSVLLNTLVFISSATYDDGGWHVVQVGVSRATQFAFIFVDGILIGKLDLSTQPIFDVPDNLLVGSDGSLFHTGGIAEIRLSGGIRNTANYVFDARQFSDDSNTVALFHFNEGGGAVAYDTSTTRNDLVTFRSTSLFQYIEGPFEVSPLTVVREQMWRALDVHPSLTRFMKMRNGQKLRRRPGEKIPVLITEQATPALTIQPTMMPDIRPETNAFHRVRLAIQLEGWLYTEDVADVEYFWWICILAIWESYQAKSTAGLLNYMRLENMYPRGPTFQVITITDKTTTAVSYFSNFRDTIIAEVTQNLLDTRKTFTVSP